MFSNDHCLIIALACIGWTLHIVHGFEPYIPKGPPLFKQNQQQQIDPSLSPSVTNSPPLEQRQEQYTPSQNKLLGEPQMLNNGQMPPPGGQQNQGSSAGEQPDISGKDCQCPDKNDKCVLNGNCQKKYTTCYGSGSAECPGDTVFKNEWSDCVSPEECSGEKG